MLITCCLLAADGVLQISGKRGCSKADDKTNTPMSCKLLEMDDLLKDPSYLIQTDGGEGLTEFEFTDDIVQKLGELGVSEPVDDSSAAANPAFTGAAGAGFDGAAPVKPGKCDIPPQLAAMLRNDPVLSKYKWQSRGFMITLTVFRKGAGGCVRAHGCRLTGKMTGGRPKIRLGPSAITLI